MLYLKWKKIKEFILQCRPLIWFPYLPNSLAKLCILPLLTYFKANDNQLHTTLLICTRQALEKFSTDCPITDDDKSNEAIYDKKVTTPLFLLFLPANCFYFS